MGQYTNGLWQSQDWAVVYQTNASLTTTGWVVFEFSEPFPYDGTNHLLVDFSFNNSSYTGNRLCRATDTGVARSLVARRDSDAGDPLDWSGSTPAPTTGALVPNLRLRIDRPVSVDPGTTGLFTDGMWTGTIAVPETGPQFYLTATDAEGRWGASDPFVVNEVNLPPELTPVEDVDTPEGSLLVVANTATDANRPVQTLTFHLGEGAPEGMLIDPVSGEIQWTPAEAQGPGTYDIVVRVTDDGLPPLTTSEPFTVTVTEVNTPPVLEPIADQTIAVGETLELSLTASDTDLPAQVLRFVFESGAPPGMVLSEGGQLTWTPAEAQAPSTHTVVVRVTDDGPPPLSATNTFRVTLFGPPVELRLVQALTLADGRFVLQWQAQAGRSYRVEHRESLEPTSSWREVSEPVVASSPTATFEELRPPGSTQRFYRVRME
jgi:hypothetical protein